MRKKWSRLIFAVLSCLVCLFPGCSDKSQSPGNGVPTDEEIQKIEDNLADQQEYLDQFAALAAVIDTNAAMDSLATLISQSPDAEWAANVVTGVNVQWASGLRGCIIIRPAGEQSELRSSARQRRNPATAVTLEPLAFVTPQSARAVYLAPMYSRSNFFKQPDDVLVANANPVLMDCGYEAFQVYKDEACNLSRIRSLSDCGILRISSVGAPWPTMTDIRDVYVASGERVTRQSIIDNWAFVENQFLGVTSFDDEDFFSFSSPYFVSFNDFEEKHPLVSLGFSWGFMGHWPTDLVNNAKAGAVTGWDWLTHPFIDAPSIGSMFLTMCDTSRTTPFTIQQWFGGIPTQYYDETSYHDFNLLYSGSNDFTLWIPLKITSISPSAALPGETVSILGAGFGSTKDKIFFGSASATDISLWTDGRIETKVPDNLPDGEVLVFVEVGGRRSNSVPFTVGIDLLSLLRTCDYLGFEIQAPHVFTSGAPDFEIFDRVFVPLVWDGANFTFDQIFGFSITSLSGSVSSDGHFLSMEWTFYNEERYGNEIVSYRTNESASVRNLPFTSYRVIFGSPYIEYLVTGADAAQYVQTLYFNDYQYDYDGNMTAYNQYVSTNWQAPGETIELECWFTRY